ncbi:MAG: hypothetical protein MPK10_09135, partial [Gammaproteobacteria bacterium]|nr:hypothetical protein [Gammaproteobacteria bacterium]
MSLPLGLDDVRIWLWLASVWGGGWLWSKAPILQPYLFYRFVGDMSDGDLRALVLVVGVANFGLVYAAFFGIPFFGVAPLLFDIVLFFGSDDAFFWSGPISLAFGGVVFLSLFTLCAPTGLRRN